MNKEKAYDLVNLIYDEELKIATPTEKVDQGRYWTTWFIACLYERDYEIVLRKRDVKNSKSKRRNKS